MSSGTGTPYFPAGYQSGYAAAQAQEVPPKPESPKPPKKPLTPYMRFSTSVWQQVKAANPGFSICEIGATIGRMWRELADEEKQRHMEDFNKDKIRYDNELQNYLKSQGLRSLKAKTKKKPEPRPVSCLPAAQPRRETNVAAATMQPPPAHTSQAVTQHQQLAQAFMGLPIAGMSGGIPMAVGMPPGMMGMLPHFSQQVWTGQQYVGGQQMMQLQLAAQQQQQQQQSGSSAVGTAQELYANGYQDLAATTSATKQMASTRDRPSGTEFRYSQNYN